MIVSLDSCCHGFLYSEFSKSVSEQSFLFCVTRFISRFIREKTYRSQRLCLWYVYCLRQFDQALSVALE